MTTPLAKLFPVADVAGFGGGQDAVAPHEQHEDELAHTLAELRASLEKLKADVSSEAQRRAAAAAVVISDGADQLRGEIRKSPGIALAVAVVAGALVGVAVTRGRPVEPAWQQTARRYRSAMNDDVESLFARADKARSGLRDAASSLMPTIERLAQKLSEMDGTQIAPALEKGSSLLRSAWQTLSGKH